MIRELLVAQLVAEGFSVAVADNGYAALDAAQQEDFDAVILDVEMLGMDGLEVARALRSDPKTALSMIIMPASMSESDVQSGFSDHDVFLPKPCDPACSAKASTRWSATRGNNADLRAAASGARNAPVGLGLEDAI